MLTLGEIEDVMPDKLAQRGVSWMNDGSHNRMASIDSYNDGGSLKTQQIDFKNSFEAELPIARKISDDEC